MGKLRIAKKYLKQCSTSIGGYRGEGRKEERKGERKGGREGAMDKY